MASRLPVFSFLLLPLVTGAQAPDHLVPEGAAYPGQAEYYSTVGKALGRAPHYQSPQMIAIPSFANEWIVGLDGERCIVVSGEAQNNLWIMHQPRDGLTDEEEEKLKRLMASWPDDPLDVEVVIHRRSLDRSLCDRIAELWMHVLQGTRYPSIAPRRLIFDGVSYHFSTWVSGRGALTGKTHSPERDSVAGKLVALGQAMRRFSRSATEQDLHSLETSLDAAEMAAQ